VDYLDLVLTFHQKYSRKWYNIKDARFLRFLISSLFIVILAIIYLANHRFDPDYIERMIGERYIEYVVDAYDKYGEESFNTIELYDIDTKTDTNESADISNATGSQSSSYSGLLNEGETFETLSHDVENIAPPSRFSKPGNRRPTGAFGSDEGSDIPLEEYKIYRDASLYLDVPEFMLEEKTRYVYRNQEDILRVIYSKSGLIESCYQKAARTNYVQSGYVKVEFHIAANGYVLPASIKILDSTIRNKDVEQCIKKNIRRWRSFERLENSTGIAHVVHKFVFN